MKYLLPAAMCLSLVFSSCTSSDDVFPVLSLEFPTNWYYDDVPGFLKDFDYTMDTGYGVCGSFGIRAGRAAFTVKGVYTSALAERDGPDLDLGLVALALQLDLYAPIYLGPSPKAKHDRFEKFLSLVYYPHATLLDFNGEGWREGAGYGMEVGFSIPSESAPVISLLGAGYRDILFSSFDIETIGEGERNRAQRSVYLFWRFEHRF
jgi:hypothetical protein